MARYAFSDDPKGGVGMEVIARDERELFNAAAAAMCLLKGINILGMREKTSGDSPPATSVN